MNLHRRTCSLLLLTIPGFGSLSLPSSPRAADLTVRVSIPADPVTVSPTPEGDRVRVDGAGWDVWLDPGTPEIPYRVVRVLLPQGETFDAFSALSPAERLVCASLSPRLADPFETDDGGQVTAPSFVVAGAAAGSALPSAPARYLGTGILHGYAIASFAVFPFEIRESALYERSEVVLTIRTRPSDTVVATRVRRREGFRDDVRARVSRMVVNPEALVAYAFNEVSVPVPQTGFTPSTFPSLEGSPVDYVIVTTDALAASMQTLADFKTAKGVPTVVRTVEWIAAHYRNGSDLAETVRNFVIDAYAKWGVTYVLIAGDVEQVPARYVYSSYYPSGVGKSMPADMYFGCLDGDWNADHDATFGEYGVDQADLYAEVYVGRLPIRTTSEATVMINKVKDYENPNHPTYGNKILMLAEVLFPNPWAPPQTITSNGADVTEFIRLSWMTDPSLNITRMYETSGTFPGSLPETRQTAIDSLNNGFNHVIHVGHGFRFNMSVGDASIVNGDADALTNGTRLANMNLLNCTAAAFGYECLAEHFLRNPNGGAVSVVGSNESAFPSVATYYMGEFYRLMFNQNTVHLGQAFADSRLPRTPLADGSDSIDRWTHFVYTLLGDPEMPLWTNTVATLSAAYPASVSKGTNSIAVTVTSGGNPVDSAVVCLSKGDEDYVVGTTDVTGQVTLKFRAETTGNIDVVVTGRNYKRYEGTISVGGTGAYVALSSMTVDDDNVGGTSGNGNGVIESGETVDFAITLKNTGTASASSLSIRLRSTDAGVTITDSTASVSGSIAAGGTGLATGGVRVVFSSTLADEHAVPFKLVVRVGTVETWKDTFKKLAHRPILDLVKLRVDDTVTGNGNGVVEAGEQFKLFYKVKNFGTGTYPGGNATVYDLDAGFTLITPTAAYGTMAPVAAVENTTGFVLIEPSVAVEHRLRVSIVDLYGRAYEDTVELRAPSAPSALVIDPSLGPDRLQVTWTASPSLDVAHYNVYRSQNALGPFTLANIDPVAHTTFTNTGLTPTTKYYYQASAIDVSGNESAMSAVFSGSTNPAQKAGWPIDMLTETTSSPAVGDIDGDGNLEIVVGDKYVYAWHANGTEMLDGDGDALTWGPINKLGDTFVSHVALASIDANPGLDIVAASRNTKQVFVFNYAGQSLPGWPRSVENFIRAGVAVGDLDGNKIPEIVAIDELGVLYAWKITGAEFVDGDANPATQGVFKRLTGATFHYSTPALADIDSDGKDEIIIGTQADQLYAFNHDGTNVPGFPVALFDDISGSPAVGDIDGDGDQDIVANVRNGNVRAIDHTGTNLWTRTLTNGISFGPSPALADVDGDGKLETFIPTSNGKLYCLTYTGTDRPGFPVTYSTTYTESSPIVADLNGDGLVDVLVGGEDKYIWAWNRDGITLEGFPLTTSDAMRGVPTAADVDRDGRVDVVAAGWDKNVYVWGFTGTWNAAKAPWPRFHANIHNNGWLGSMMPTPVGGAMFSYSIRGSGMELAWVVPLEAGTVFAVERAEVVNGRAGSYTTIARSVGIGVDGVVRVVDRGVEEGSRYAYRLEGDGGTVHETAGLYVPVTRAVLGQNYPNPFNPVTRIEYWVPGEGGGKTAVSVVVYDVRGARVRTLVNEGQVAGRYSVEWDGRDDRGVPVGSGVYFYRLRTPRFADARKMLLMK